MAANEFKLEDYMSFFKFGQTPSAIKAPTSLTGGLGIPTEERVKFISHQRMRHDDGDAYAHLYQEEENEALRKQPSRHGTVELPDGNVLHLSQLDEIEEVTTVGGDIQSPHELEREETSTLYSTYYSSTEHVYDSKLTITSCKDDIVRNIQARDVVVIQGATGCGKTTQVPQYIMDDCVRRGVYCNIVVTQPRRIAAMSIARRVCQERGWRLGSFVGYQVGMDRVSSEDTRLLYVTTGVLLEKLVQAKNMNAYTHVIVDEVHERDQDTDLAMLVVRMFLRSVSRSVKVILMSATIDTDIYSSYFSSLVRSSLEPARVIHIEGKSPYALKVFYVNDLKTLGPLPNLSAEDPKVAEEAYNLALQLVLTFDRIEIQELEEETEEGMASVRGTVLMFLPGYEEISKMQKLLHPHATSKRWWILPLHSTITKEEQNRVFDRPQHGYRKIILSTNIAESSITVPDIKYVIDFCLTRSLVCDPVTNYHCLQLEWASKANCQQRQGRAGRTSEGRVYRMVSLRFYEDYLPEYSVPEMRRCPLDQSILRVKKLDLGEPKRILGVALEPPNLVDIEVAILNLKEVGALATTVNGQFYAYDGDMTFIGRVMSILPMDIKVSRLILLGMVFDCLEDCIIIAASLSVTTFFAKPFMKMLESYKSKLAWSEQSFSDCFAYLQAYKMWRVHVENNLFANTGLREDKWAQNNFIQLRKIKDVDYLIRELKQRLATVGIRVPNSPHLHANDINRNMSLILKFVICGAFYPNYFIQEELDEKEVNKTMGNKNPLNSVMVTGLPQNQGILYEHRLRDILQACHPEMDIDYEEKKAYIQFGNETPDSSKVMTAVYIAVKMRQLQMPMTVSVFTPVVAKQKMERLEKLRNEFCDRNKALRSNRVKMQSQHHLQGNLRHAPLPGIEKDVFKLQVSHILDCGHFYARYNDDDNVHNSGYLQHMINMLNGENLKPLRTALRPNMLVLAPYTDNGHKQYFRAIYIENKDNPVHASKMASVQVFFVDYGNTTKVPIQELREIDLETMMDLYTSPAQALKCALVNVRAVINPQTSNRQYKDEANFWFKRTVNGMNLTARVYSVVQDTVRVELLRTLEDGQEVSINHELTLFKYAEPHEESYQSRQNHDLRIQCKRKNMNKLEVESYNRAQEDDHCVAISLNEMDSSGSTSLHKLRLHGPYSPLEVSYLGMTTKVISRKVKIERDSVNSVTLDPEPQDKSSHMLVSSNMSIASDNSFISCRNTTIMPNIRGLPSLMALIFTPCAEFRTDPEVKHLTGAICGLGYNPRTKEALYPDHDMELAFDTEITLDDIYKINSVRICINFLLGQEENVINTQPAMIRDVQARARKTITELICQNRDPVKPVPFWNLYEWGQVKKELLLKTELGNTTLDCDNLLPLHEAISLNADSWKDTIREQIRQLHRRANRLQITEMNKCMLCHVTTHTPKELLDHLNTYEHKRKEDVLLQD